MSHSPQGECGLKLLSTAGELDVAVSLPARGVWIEIKSSCATVVAPGHSPQGECGLKY